MKNIPADKLKTAISQLRSKLPQSLDGLNEGQSGFARGQQYELATIEAEILYLEQEGQPRAACRTCGFHENNCPRIRGGAGRYPSVPCKDYTYSAMKAEKEPSNDIGHWLRAFGMPEENIEGCITQIAQGYGACRYLEGVQHGAEASVELAAKTKAGKVHFSPICWFVQKIPSDKWDDKANKWAKALRDRLVREGYAEDARVLQEYISHMNGHNVPVDRTDSQEPPAAAPGPDANEGASR